MAIKRNLLQIVQSILSDTDGAEVNTILDTVESSQVTNIIENTFYDLVSTRIIEEHSGLIVLTALSDTTRPTHFTIPDNVKRVGTVWYKDDTGLYYEVTWQEPLDFLNASDRITENYATSIDLTSGTTLRVRNNHNPTYFTSFDNKNIVMDSYDATVEATLQQSKVRAQGYTIPVFVKSDTYVPDIDEVRVQLLINEATSRVQSLFKGGPDPKTEQAARRQKSYVQNDQLKVGEQNNWKDYGR